MFKLENYLNLKFSAELGWPIWECLQRPFVTGAKGTEWEPLLIARLRDAIPMLRPLGAELGSARVGATLGRPVNAVELVFFFFSMVFLFFWFPSFTVFYSVFSFLFSFFSLFFFLTILNIFKI
jgi:hypothetical protein